MAIAYSSDVMKSDIASVSSPFTQFFAGSMSAITNSTRPALSAATASAGDLVRSGSCLSSSVTNVSLVVPPCTPIFLPLSWSLSLNGLSFL